MLDLAKRIAAIEDPADRMRLGAQLLGDEFQILYPLLLKGADGFNVAAAEVDRFGGALSAKEIQDLQATNAKIEELKNQLSRNVAKVVADNAESINALADSLFTLADGAIKATGEFVKFIDTEQRYRNSVASLPQGLSPDQRAAAVGDLNRRFGRRETVTGSYLGGLITTKDVRFEPNALSDLAGVAGYVERSLASVSGSCRGQRCPRQREPCAALGHGGRRRLGASVQRGRTICPDRLWHVRRTAVLPRQGDRDGTGADRFDRHRAFRIARFPTYTGWADFVSDPRRTGRPRRAKLVHRPLGLPRGWFILCDLGGSGQRHDGQPRWRSG